MIFLNVTDAKSREKNSNNFLNIQHPGNLKDFLGCPRMPWAMYAFEMCYQVLKLLRNEITAWGPWNKLHNTVRTACHGTSEAVAVKLMLCKRKRSIFNRYKYARRQEMQSKVGH